MQAVEISLIPIIVEVNIMVPTLSTVSKVLVSGARNPSLFLLLDETTAVAASAKSLKTLTCMCMSAPVRSAAGSACTLRELLRIVSDFRQIDAASRGAPGSDKRLLRPMRILDKLCCCCCNNSMPPDMLPKLLNQASMYGSMQLAKPQQLSDSVGNVLET